MDTTCTVELMIDVIDVEDDTKDNVVDDVELEVLKPGGREEEESSNVR